MAIGYCAQCGHYHTGTAPTTKGRGLILDSDGETGMLALWVGGEWRNGGLSGQEDLLRLLRENSLQR